MHSRLPQLMAVSIKYVAPSLFSGDLELRLGLKREDALQGGAAASASGAAATAAARARGGGVHVTHFF